MKRKPLPKAITRSIANLQELAADFVADEQGRIPRKPASFDHVEPEPPHAAKAHAPAAHASTAHASTAHASTAHASTAHAPAAHAAAAHAKSHATPHETHQAAPAQQPAMPAPGDPRTARRRAIAQKIVERHRNYAAMGGLLPLPVVNIAGVTAINLRMVRQLCALYGVPFRRDRARSMIVGLIGGAVPTGFGAATASTLAFVVPASALVGLAVSAVTAGALTRGIGLVFIEHFEASAG